MPATHTCDVAIVGGGLAGALIALALARRRPDCELRLIEGSGRIGGNRLWSFFATDVAAAPYACASWYDSNYWHVYYGRAYAYNGNVYATNSNQYLGYYSTAAYTSVRRTSAGYYAYGSCPA